MIPKIRLRQSRDFGEIINDTIVFIIQNWKGLLKIYAVLCGFFIAGNMVFSILFQFRVINTHKETLGGGNVYSSYGSLGIEYFMLLLFGFLNLVACILTMSSFVVIYNQKNGEMPTVPDVWMYFKYYFWRGIRFPASAGDHVHTNSVYMHVARNGYDHFKPCSRGGNGCNMCVSAYVLFYNRIKPVFPHYDWGRTPALAARLVSVLSSLKRNSGAHLGLFLL